MILKKAVKIDRDTTFESSLNDIIVPGRTTAEGMYDSNIVSKTLMVTRSETPEEEVTREETDLKQKTKESAMDITVPRDFDDEYYYRIIPRQTESNRARTIYTPTTIEYKEQFTGHEFSEVFTRRKLHDQTVGFSPDGDEIVSRRIEEKIRPLEKRLVHYGKTKQGACPIVEQFDLHANMQELPDYAVYEENLEQALIYRLQKQSGSDEQDDATIGFEKQQQTNKMSFISRSVSPAVKSDDYRSSHSGPVNRSGKSSKLKIKEEEKLLPADSCTALDLGIIHPFVLQQKNLINKLSILTSEEEKAPSEAIEQEEVLNKPASIKTIAERKTGLPEINEQGTTVTVEETKSSNNRKTVTIMTPTQQQLEAGELSTPGKRISTTSQTILAKRSLTPKRLSLFKAVSKTSRAKIEPKTNKKQQLTVMAREEAITTTEPLTSTSFTQITEAFDFVQNNTEQGFRAEKDQSTPIQSPIVSTTREAKAVFHRVGGKLTRKKSRKKKTGGEKKSNRDKKSKIKKSLTSSKKRAVSDDKESKKKAQMGQINTSNKSVPAMPRKAVPFVSIKPAEQEDVVDEPSIKKKRKRS
ncbi:unnamed protein product, partial [Didymodactylos carnosus]